MLHVSMEGLFFRCGGGGGGLICKWGGCAPHGGISFDGGFLKKKCRWRGDAPHTPPLWETRLFMNIYLCL